MSIRNSDLYSEETFTCHSCLRTGNTKDPDRFDDCRCGQGFWCFACIINTKDEMPFPIGTCQIKLIQNNNLTQSVNSYELKTFICHSCLGTGNTQEPDRFDDCLCGQGFWCFACILNTADEMAFPIGTCQIKNN